MSPDLQAWHELGTPKVVLSLWRGLIEVKPKLTVDAIQKVVCAYYRVTQVDMLSERRAREIARPRQVAMWLCRKLTKRSLPDIGRRFGERDHTTVIAAVKRVEQLRTTNTFIRHDCRVLLEQLGGEVA